ncbi:hypothetical protein VTI74DRAFT_7849 [Chaetomium olivicolor]
MLAVGDCSGEACPVPPGSLPYAAAPGNVFILAAFAALTPPVVYAGLRYRTVLHSSFLLAALLVEVVGHVGKVFLVANPTSHPFSAVYLLGTHWGAILIGSAIYLALPHVIVVYGQEFRLVSDPAYLNIFFFIFDIFALAFQSVGIGFASTANTATEVSQGVNILLTGLAIQAVSLLAFLCIYRYFRYRLSHRRYILDDQFSLVYLSRRFKNLLICVQVVAALLIIRTAVRIAIFASGLSSPFARSPLTSFLLDDTLVLLAALILSVYPTGRAFGHAWSATSPCSASNPNSADNNILPLRLRRYRRNRSSRNQISKHVISLPYPSSVNSPRFSPGFSIREGMPSGLPAHPSPRAAQAQYATATTQHSPHSQIHPSPSVYVQPLITSPRNNPVHQRVAPPYDNMDYDTLIVTSPTTTNQSMPFLAGAGPQESPAFASAASTGTSTWAMMTPGAGGFHQHGYGEQGRRQSERERKGKEEGMVDGDALW